MSTYCLYPACFVWPKCSSVRELVDGLHGGHTAPSFSTAQSVLKVHGSVCRQCKRMTKEQRKLSFHGLASPPSPGAGSLGDGACRCRAGVSQGVTWCGLPEAVACAWGCLGLWEMLHDCSAQEFELMHSGSECCRQLLAAGAQGGGPGQVLPDPMELS